MKIYFLPIMFQPNSLTDFVQHPTFEPQVLAVKNAAYPKLSVITPSFNQAAFLERTILSVLNQNYPNLEYIIIDGGSSDGSVEIIKKYEKYLHFWVSEKDNGQVDAINKGLLRATGEWLSFQNSDDVYAPNALVRVAAEITKSRSVDILYGHIVMIDEHDIVIEQLKTVPFCRQCQVAEGMQIHNQSLFFKRSLIDRFGLFDTAYQFAFDYEFITRFTMNTSVVCRQINYFLGGFRKHISAKTSTISDVGTREHETIKQRYTSQIDSVLGLRFWLWYCRLRKMGWFLLNFDFAYIKHRQKI